MFLQVFSLAWRQLYRKDSNELDFRRYNLASSFISRQIHGRAAVKPNTIGSVAETRIGKRSVNSCRQPQVNMEAVNKARNERTIVEPG